MLGWLSCPCFTVMLWSTDRLQLRWFCFFEVKLKVQMSAWRVRYKLNNAATCCQAWTTCTVAVIGAVCLYIWAQWSFAYWEEEGAKHWNLRHPSDLLMEALMDWFVSELILKRATLRSCDAQFREDGQEGMMTYCTFQRQQTGLKRETVASSG